MLTTGQGWRLGYRPGQQTHCALVGSVDWAFELTATEWQDFLAAARSLVQAWATIAPHLMPGEETTLEQAVGTVLLVAEGLPEAYSLYLQVTPEASGRACEGTWPVASVPELLQTLLSWPDV